MPYSSMSGSEGRASCLVQYSLYNYRSWSSKLISADGSRIATGSDDDLTVRIWDMATGRELSKLPLPPSAVAVLGIAWNPDGTRLAAMPFKYGEAASEAYC